jgi:hypothetical protein
MKTKYVLGGLLAALAMTLTVSRLVAEDAKPDAEGYTAIFDGKTLEGWDGNPEFWKVEDGAIVGQTTKEKPTKGNTFLIWKKGETGNFTLKAKFKIEGGNSGIQYRSKDRGKWVVNGYQADIDSAPTGGFIGILYEEGGRGILAQRGTTVVIPEGGKPEVQKENKAADAKEIIAGLKKGDWNDYEITAKGNHLVQKINGLVTVDVTDNDTKKGASTGILALQLHAGPPMKVQFKDLMLKKLD